MVVIKGFAAALAQREGQALVEFALVLPLILLIIFGVIDFGKAWNYKNDETSLANQAARYATVNVCAPCGGQSIEAYVKSLADTGELRNGTGQIDSPGVTISFCFPARSAGRVGDALQATATATYNWLPYLGLNPGAKIASTVIVRLEQAYDPLVASNNAYGNGTAGSTFPIPRCS